MKKIIVTGINGFLGSNVAKALKQNNEVKGIGRVADTSGETKIYSSSDLESIKMIPDVIVMCHAAVSSGNISSNSKALFDSNVLLTEKIIERFPSAKCIYISSVSVFSSTGNTVIENAPINPVTGYSVSKYWGELVSKQQAQSVIIRLSSLYGIQMKENTLIPNYVNQALKNNKIEVWGKGERKQNYFHVQDAVGLINAVIENAQRNKEIYLGVDTQEYSNLEIAQIIASETNAAIAFTGTDASASVHYNNEVTRTSLSWAPSVSIATGLKEYIEWKKKQL